LGLVEAWGAALAYTVQLYFDFSGYSDMAVGISRLFGIRLPANFYSPYKAESIVEFWRRWHMTLSRFLRDYLYIPLGGNLHGTARRYLNLLATMLLGGLWHGAGWTFIVWGGLHGTYLIVNHTWSAAVASSCLAPLRGSRPWRFAAWGLTFLCVSIAWVFFRADTLETALSILSGMAGMNGMVLPEGWLAKMGGLGSSLTYFGVTSADISDSFGGRQQLAWTSLLLAIAWFAPNTQEIMARYRPVLAPYSENMPSTNHLQWRPDRLWLCFIGALAIWAILNINRVSEFLYWQF
jgi:hypothetical protein